MQRKVQLAAGFMSSGLSEGLAPPQKGDVSVEVVIAEARTRKKLD